MRHALLAAFTALSVALAYSARTRASATSPGPFQAPSCGGFDPAAGASQSLLNDQAACRAGQFLMEMQSARQAYVNGATFYCAFKLENEARISSAQAYSECKRAAMELSR